jgi:hypothetical protein
LCCICAFEVKLQVSSAIPVPLYIWYSNSAIHMFESLPMNPKTTDILKLNSDMSIILKYLYSELPHIPY